MLLKFVGDPIEAQQAADRGAGISRVSITVEGVYFPLNVPVDASAIPAHVLRKLAKNSHFEVVDGGARAPEAADDAAPEATVPAAPRGQRRGTVKAAKDDA